MCSFIKNIKTYKSIKLTTYRSVINLLDEMEASKASYAYDPFGTVLRKDENVVNEYEYLGQLGVISQPLGKLFILISDIFSQLKY